MAKMKETGGIYDSIGKIGVKKTWLAETTALAELELRQRFLKRLLAGLNEETGFSKKETVTINIVDEKKNRVTGR